MDQDQLSTIIEYCLEKWCEHELPWCEFKKDFHSSEEIGQNISAISNVCRLMNKPHWYVVFWIDPKSHTPIWTKFDYKTQKWKWNEDLLPWLIRGLDKFSNFDFYEIEYGSENIRIILLCIESTVSKPVAFENTVFIRIDSYTKPIKWYDHLQSKLWEKILWESFDSDICLSNISDTKVMEVIDIKWYLQIMWYDLKDDNEWLEKLIQDGLLIFSWGLYSITNACGLLFARDLGVIDLKSKFPRVITYRWNNRLHAINDEKWVKWYALGFSWLINYVYSQIPNIEIIESERSSEPLYPKVALREFIANAIIHQDLRIKWVEVLIEIFDDRIEISNPWVPLIEIDRFFDHPPKSRNELLADFMRRSNHCEKRWSGIDRAMDSIRIQWLPNPKIEKNEDFTRVVIFRARSILKLTDKEKAESIYWHCVLVFVLENEAMTNESVCERFWIEPQNSANASRLIKLAKDEWKIKPFDPKSRSRKHAKYIPIWAE